MNHNVSAVYVQYGCGWCAPYGWRNFDASPTLRFEKIPFLGTLYTRNANRFPKNAEWGNIAYGLPIAENSCAGIYCSHVLEHLAMDEFRVALKETFRILKPGGIFRLVLPDLEHEVAKYIKDATPDAAINFMHATSLGKIERPRGIKGLVLEFLGNSQHLTMWDYKTIANELNKAGFVDIRRASFADSKDSKFSEVEDITRWENALGVECCK